MKSEKILILEVNEKNYNVLKNLFEKKVYETTAILNEEDFVQHLSSNSQYDLIIVNAHVKYLNIREDIKQLTEVVKEQEPIPFICIDSSPSHDKYLLEDSFEAGAVDYVKKPFTSKELLARVQQHLETGKKIREYKLRIDKLANLATVDQLSKSTSKMHMQAILRHELNNFKRYGNEPVTIIYLGIVTIEKYISAFGLDQGEKLITQFAKFLRTNLRESDVLARWIGAEFVILLTNTDVKTTETVVQKVKRLLAIDKKIQEKSQLEIAFGISELKKSDDYEELLSRAQYAYKAAKKQTYGKIEIT